MKKGGRTKEKEDRRKRTFGFVLFCFFCLYSLIFFCFTHKMNSRLFFYPLSLVLFCGLRVFASFVVLLWFSFCSFVFLRVPSFLSFFSFFFLFQVFSCSHVKREKRNVGVEFLFSSVLFL